ncbi:uncharacterized protein LOC126264923 [Aethina tumida]|uniref:uncharacterized protein LOC126264923 n=1 Tax=Aethina tumida TaxID=116153 RepID=UPI0021498E62|nr:uncharacterized protein LOC126264923 [Aethina tumida]
MTHIVNDNLGLASSDVTSKIYTWYPYTKFSCGNNFDKIKIIAKCKRNKLIQNKPLFEDKITTIYNCPVRTRAILWSPFIMRVDNEYTGIEVSMLKTISEVLKFNPIFSVSKVPLNWGSINETGGSTGLLGALIKNKADIGIASLGTTSRNSPRGKVRVVTGCWCVFCWIISILYVTSMIGRLTRPNYFVSYPITMLMKKDFPLRNRINTVILRICGAGLFQLWESVYLRCVGKTKSEDHTSS